MEEGSSKMSEEKQPTPDAQQPAQEAAGEPPPANEPLEKEIDLNSIFPDAEHDLNALFPDMEIKTLLKKINKDKKDLHSLKDRFLLENETEDDAADQEV
jgi:hypothetical protein